MVAKVLIVFIAFFNHEIISKSLDSFLSERKWSRHSVEILVLENESPKSEYVANVTRNLPVIHFRYGKNAAANVIVRARQAGILKTEDYDFVAVTEGDVVLDSGLLDEAVDILARCPELDLVNADVHLTNLPLKNFPEAATWMPPAKEAGQYLVGDTGLQFVLSRREPFEAFLTALERGELRETTVLTWHPCQSFSDRNWRAFNAKRGKLWARTPERKLLHIGWDLYVDLDNDYIRLKNSLVASGSFWQDEGEASVFTRVWS